MERLKGFLFLAGGFMLAGTSVVAARYVSGILGTFTIASISLLFAIAALSLAGVKRLAKTLKDMNGHDWLMTVLQAVFGIFLFRMFLLKGLLSTSAAETGILTGVTPAATAILSAFALKETVRLRNVIGILCTVSGVVLIQGFTGIGGITASHLTGNIFVILAALSESVFNILSKASSLRASAAEQKAAFDPLAQTTIVSCAAFLLCLIPAAFEKPVPSMLSLGITGWISLAWYGFFVTALAYIFWYAGIKRCKASTAAAFSGLMPFTAMVLSVLVLGEKPGLLQWTGGILVIIGIWALGASTSREKRIPLVGTSVMNRCVNGDK